MNDDEKDPALSQEDETTSEDAGDVSDDTEIEEPEEPETSDEPEEPETPEGEGTPEASTDQLEIVVQGRKPKKAAPDWLKKVRSDNDKLARRNAELERLISETAPAAAAPIKKPKFEECGYDDEIFEKKLLEWDKDQQKRDNAQAEAQQQVEKSRAAHKAKQDAYDKSKKELSEQISDYPEAEAAVELALGTGQEGSLRRAIVLHYLKEPALVVAALGRDPELLEEVMSEKDPTMFAIRLREVEASVKTTKKPGSKVPGPERRISGSGSPAKTGGDAKLDKLLEEARRTKDFTKVIAHNQAVEERKNKQAA